MPMIRAFLRRSTSLQSPPIVMPPILPPDYVSDMEAIARKVLGRTPIMLWHPDPSGGPIWIEGMHNMPIGMWMLNGAEVAGHA